MSAIPFDERAAADGATRLVVCTYGVLAAAISIIFWYVGDVCLGASGFVGPLLLLIVGSAVPLIADCSSRRFDPLDAKYLFLSYFFLVFTIPSIAEVWWGFVPDGMASPDALSVRVRALSAISFGLAALIVGCYCPLPRANSWLFPKLKQASTRRLMLVAVFGIAAGLVAFILLMRSAGGVLAFNRDRETWRTVGVLAGVGHLTFPISVVLPSSVLLLYIVALSDRWTVVWMYFVAVLLGGTILCVGFLGFRIVLVPFLLQIIMVWHYRRRRFHILKLLVVGLLLASILSAYAIIRGLGTNEPVDAGKVAAALLFRVPGLATVERVVQRSEAGEPTCGVAPLLTESATILVPRAIWADKPESRVVRFADLFFFDFFLLRGDSIDGIRSGITPTIVGDGLWCGGIWFVGASLFMIGVFSQMLRFWCGPGRGVLGLFFYAVLASNMPLLIESLQNGLNSFAMLFAMLLSIYVAAVFPVRGKPGV